MCGGLAEMSAVLLAPRQRAGWRGPCDTLPAGLCESAAYHRHDASEWLCFGGTAVVTCQCVSEQEQFFCVRCAHVTVWNSSGLQERHGTHAASVNSQAASPITALQQTKSNTIHAACPANCRRCSCSQLHSTKHTHMMASWPQFLQLEVHRQHSGQKQFLHAHHHPARPPSFKTAVPHLRCCTVQHRVPEEQHCLVPV